MAERSLINRLWYRFSQRSLFLVEVLAYGVRYSGRENIPKTGPVLLVSNHQSHFDPPLVGVPCPRRMNYVARDTLFRFPPLAWLMRSLDAIPIDRDGVGMTGIKESLRRLKRGEMVLVFPEGTRSRDGEIGTFRPGFTMLAARSGAAILPVAVDGAFDAWPRWRKLPRLGKIRVHYGRPIPFEEIQGRDERELVAEVKRRVHECLAILRRQSLRANGQGLPVVD